jgi:hypothetical protein
VKRKLPSIDPRLITGRRESEYDQYLLARSHTSLMGGSLHRIRTCSIDSVTWKGEQRFPSLYPGICFQSS